VSCPAQNAKRSLAAEVSLCCRRCLYVALLILCALVLLQSLVVEAFHIPTGSMAPALHGNYRVCVCPRCGHEVAVGRHAADREGSGEPRYYRKAFCPNCGLYPVPVTTTPEIPGDEVVVDKTAYLVRSPSRWEIIVFRLLGTFYIKRLLGMPGEDILIHDGDLYVNGQLYRKSFEEAKRMRVLVFDQENAPKAGGWKDRWEQSTAAGTPTLRGADSKRAHEAGQVGNLPQLTIDGRLLPCALTYRHFLLGSGKCEPMRDEYGYNGGLHADSECVHDFLIETEIESSAGRGSLALRLCDGHDWVEVVLPVGATRAVEAFAWPIDAPAQTCKLAEAEKPALLRAKQPYRIELAFVDRRVSVAVDGRVWLSADLPAAKKRRGVERPFQVQADGVHANLRHFRLYRDVHYTQQGTNAVRGKSVHLGMDQYFMLGDNSTNSEDSRFWPDGGRVDAACLIGPVIHVHGSRPSLR
jgi:signal peptidase I